MYSKTFRANGKLLLSGEYFVLDGALSLALPTRFGQRLLTEQQAQTVRLLAEERFHHGSDACIVCTSTLELGIDVGDLDRVFQSEAPDSVSSFLQRMGRTGRRSDQVANTTFFCETSEGVLRAIALIELAKSGWVEDVPVTDRCWPVMVHQLFAPGG